MIIIEVVIRQLVLDFQITRLVAYCRIYRSQLSQRWNMFGLPLKNQFIQLNSPFRFALSYQNWDYVSIRI
jgi:hypothetical protein